MYKIRESTVIELRKTGLEWTRVANGYFMDYYGMPHVKTYLKPLFFVVDPPNKTAAIPGTGDEVLSFTYTFDVAKFVVAFLSLPKWEEITYCYGENSTFNKLVALAEEAQGMLFHFMYLIEVRTMLTDSKAPSSKLPTILPKSSQRERLQNCLLTLRYIHTFRSQRCKACSRFSPHGSLMAA